MTFLFSLFYLSLFCSLPLYSLEGHCSNESGKIGIRTDWDRVIVKCYHGCPAYYAGLRIGDKILLVDGTKNKEISGPAHEVVTLVVLRDNKELEFKVERAYESEVKIMREAAFMAEIGEEP
jgi:C-terminal processing protease CtpA/Prc